MPSILLHISARHLNDRITALGNRMNELKAIWEDYNVLNDDVKTFMGETDDNFEQMRENVRRNIQLVAKAYNIAKANQQQLQSELASLSELQTAVGTTLQTGIGTAQKTVDLIKVAADIDI